MEVIRKNPFLFLLLFVIMGIYMNISMYIPVIFALYITIIALSLLLVYRLFTRKKIQRKLLLQPLYITAITLLLIAVGITLAHIKTKQVKSDFTDQQAVFALKIIDTPIEKTKTFLCKAQVFQQYTNNSSRTTKGNVILYIDKDSLSASLEEGDILLCQTTFPSYKPTKNPETFDYNKYLFRQSITSTAYIPSHKWKRVGKDTTFSVITLAHKCRTYLINTYKKQGIKNQNLAVLSALTLGDKQQLDVDTKIAYSASGAMHILAVSGLHVGIIYAILYLLLFPLRRQKKHTFLSFIITLLALWSYAFITGLAPSVLRATIMFSVILIGQTLNRKSYIYNTIALSAFFLLIHNPFHLYHVGFQLSYSAVFAIVFLQPKLYKLIYIKYKVLDYIWSLLTVSFAAQIGTFIWSLLYFHQFSTYFLFTNLGVIPMAYIILHTAALFFLISFVPIIASWIAWLLNMEISLLNSFVHGIESLPMSTLHTYIDSYQALLLFIALLGILFAVTLSDYKQYIIISLSTLSLIVAVTISLMRWNNSLQQQKLIVYEAGNTPIIQLVNAQQATIYTNDTTRVKHYTETLSLKYYINNNYQIINDKHLTGFVFKGETYTILQGNLLHNKVSEKTLNIDHLIVTDVKDTHVEKIIQMIHTKHIIITPALKPWKRNKLKELCNKNNIKHTDIHLTGAYIVE